MNWKGILWAGALAFAACSDAAVTDLGPMTPLAMPAAPQLVTLETARYNHLAMTTTLRWTPYAGPATLAEYRIYVEKGTGTQWRHTPQVTTGSTLVATIDDTEQTSYTVQHLREPVTYLYYRVLAIGINGQTLASNTLGQTGLHLYQRSITHDSFGCPSGIEFRQNRNVLITDSDSGTVYEFSTAGSLVRTYGEGRSVEPYFATEDKNGNVIVSDYGANELAWYDNDGNFLFAIHPASPGRFQLSPKRGMVVPLYDSNQLAIYEPGSLTPKKYVGGLGAGPGEFDGPWEVWRDGWWLFVLDVGNNRVQVFDSEGNYVRHFGDSGKYACREGHCWGMTLAPEDKAYLVDRIDGILVYNRNGKFEDYIPATRFENEKPLGANFSPAGELYVSRCDTKEDVMIFGP